jgi:2-haloacid dehalogenase
MEAYLALDAYPEVPTVLERLKRAGQRTAILSNGEPRMLAAGASSAGIEGLLDANLSIEAVGIFKPHPKTYQIAVDQFGVQPGEVAFLSSNAWDVHGASVFGFQAVWVNRREVPLERLPGGPSAVLKDLTGLPGLLGL